MSALNRPLRVWHAVVAVIATLALGAGGTALAVSGKAPTASKANLGSQGGISYKSTGAILNGSGNATGSASCGNKHVVGGGVATSSGQQFVNESRSYDGTDADSTPDDGWIAYVNANGTTTATFTVYAICVKHN